MQRFFNTTGPCRPDHHYMLPPSRRIPEALDLVRRQQYFVIHAPRQVGKTTAMMAFAEELRAQGYAAVWTSMESGQGMTDVASAEPVWISSICSRVRRQLAMPFEPPAYEVGHGIYNTLGALAVAVAPRPLVLLLDEADTASGPALVSLLRQLRDGFTDRAPGVFATSVVLIGMRDLRDYLSAAKDGSAVNPGSPFNIKAGSLTMRGFNADEVAELVSQHTVETGQVFLPEASAEIFAWTSGQPFLVNAIALYCMDNLVPDRTVAITAAHVEEAKNQLILSRTTHLDALAERLKEPRVARIVEAVLLGDERIDYSADDFRYVTDLGLIVRGPTGAEAANRVYREVLAREIGYNSQMNTPPPWWPWAGSDGRLNYPALIGAFRQYWREHADTIAAHLPQYPEAVAHIAFMAFLQRVVNGGGHVEREFAAGRGAVDVVTHYRGERFVTEIKRVRPKDSLESVRAQGITQLGKYLDSLGLTEGWLLLVDQRAGRSWDQRMWAEDVAVEGRVLHVVGV